MEVLVFVEDKPTFKLRVENKSRIKDIKKALLEKYTNHRIRMLLNDNKELKVFDDDKYDSLTLESVWKDMKNPQILLKEKFDLSNKALTGIKDLDFLIMSKMNDKDLFNFCITNKDADKLCKNQDFWRNRFLDKFGKHAMKYNSSQSDKQIPSFEGIYKPENRNWRNHYLKIVTDLDEYRNNPFSFFDRISWVIDNEPKNIYHDDSYENSSIVVLDRSFTLVKVPEKQTNQYWLLNLGNKITILYTIDRYDEMSPKSVEYKTDTYFTPVQVLKLIYNFYQEPLTKEELQRMQNAGARFADDYTLDQAERGEVKRIDLMGGLVHFEGFELKNGKFVLGLGS